jgi:hypothetical protein
LTKNLIVIKRKKYSIKLRKNTMEKKFEFASEYDLISKTHDMLVALRNKGIRIPTIMKSNGSLIPLFGEFKTQQPVKFIIRIGRFGKWKNRDGAVAEFNTEEEADAFLNKVVKRHYKGAAYVDADDDQQPGTATYYLADSTVEALQNLDKKWIHLYNEWDSFIMDITEDQKNAILDLQLEDEHDNAVLSSIKLAFIEAWNASKKKAAEKAQREERVAKARAAAAKLEAEWMKFPLYKIFSTIERWDENDGYFNKLKIKTAWIGEEIKKEEAHRVEMEKLRKADPEPADGGFFGDSGWYDE